MSQRGFTLIELLVVIAIIGVLSSVVLASLNTARNKASDAAIKAQLSEMRAAAELLYSNTGSYDTVCDPSTNSGQMALAAFAKTDKVDGTAVCLSSGTTIYYANNGTFGSFSKTASPDKWAVSMVLKSGKYFCVDYTGRAQEQNGRVIDGSPLTTQCL